MYSYDINIILRGRSRVLQRCPSRPGEPGEGCCFAHPLRADRCVGQTSGADRQACRTSVGHARISDKEPPTRPRYWSQWHIIKSRFCRRVLTKSQSVRVLIVDGIKRHEDEGLQASLDMQCRASRCGRLPVGRNHSAVRDNDLVCGVPVLPPCGVRTRTHATGCSCEPVRVSLVKM
jgi:hypothetical protein